MANKKQEIETTVAIEEVKKADEKVEKIKADRAAKKAARMQKRLEWKGPFKLVGKIINAYDERPGEMVTATLLGGGAGAAAVWGGRKLLDKYGKKTDDVTGTDETSDEAEEAPFEEA